MTTQVRPKIPDERDFTSWLRSPAVTARIGLWLGVCFGLAFVTGLVSHWAQTPSPWLPFPTSPSWGYRVTQGVHVTAGTAAVPLLLVKLWTVFPKLFARPPREVRYLTVHGLERISIAVLVAASIFQLVTGLANAAQWYPVALQLPPHPLRPRLGRDRRSRRARRGQASRHPERTDGGCRQHRPGPPHDAGRGPG